jgi:5,5'-dehydrodivanillate O-demethylase
VRIKSYPVKDYLGLIFVYIGDGYAPLLPRFPEFETAGVLYNSGYVRACNYFQNLENGADEAHVAFVHRDSDFSVHGLNWDIPRITTEETDYGLVYRAARANGVVRTSHVLMPNILRIRIPPVDPAETAWREHITWRVPIEDERHLGPAVALVHLTGEAAERYREEQQARRAPVQPPADEVVAAILRGERHVDEFKDRPDIVGIQDDVSQIGQGAIADRKRERLGRSDVAVYLLRKIWTRELRALAEGRPLKEWAHSQPLPATTGV